MQENIIYVPSFQGKHKTGLIFSMIDGLKSGSQLTLICDQSPDELESLLQQSDLQHLTWKNTQDPQSGEWKLVIHKEEPLNSESVGCCGICGGNSSEKRGS